MVSQGHALRDPGQPLLQVPPSNEEEPDPNMDSGFSFSWDQFCDILPQGSVGEGLTDFVESLTTEIKSE